jgi:hypothetical protein
MKGGYLVLAVAILGVSAACARQLSREAGGEVAIDETSSGGGSWGANIRGEGGWERIHGSAFALPRDDGTRVSVTIDRGVAGSNYPWDVRDGNCMTPGRVIGDSASYTPLFLDDDGRGSRVMDLPVRLERDKAYVIRLYTPTDDRTAIACGALKR